MDHALIAVRDMERAVRFYQEILGQTVALDLGGRKRLACGLTLFAQPDPSAAFPELCALYRLRAKALYVEVADFDGLAARLKRHPEVALLRGPETYPWRQRGVLLCDPDGYLVEAAEPMRAVAYRCFRAGHTAAEAARLTQHPRALVQAWFDDYAAGEPF